MPLQILNALSGLQGTPDTSWMGEIFNNMNKTRKGAVEARFAEPLAKQDLLSKELENAFNQTRNKYAEPKAQGELQELGLKNQYYGRSKEAEIAEAFARAQHYKDVGSGKTFAPSALGKLIQERNDLAAKDPKNPLIAEYDRVIKAQGGSKFAPSGLGKLYTELQQVEEGYLPGSNGTIELSSLEQKELRDKYKLQIQKTSTDSATRTTALRGQNLLKSIDASNIDALTRYSGPKGAAKLKLEQGKDLTGKPSEEYLQHLEAIQAVKLEAKELRQFFGDSITPEVQDALYEMVNATSLTKSPEAAKRMIQKSRDTIKKQIKTFEDALKTTEAFSTQEPHQVLGDQLYNGLNQGQSQEMITIKHPKTGETKQISRAEYEAGRKKR